MPFLEMIGIGKVLYSVGTSLASKAPAAAYGKWSASRQTQEDFAAAWTDAREKTIAEYSGFGAIVDEAELQKAVFEHALNPPKARIWTPAVPKRRLGAPRTRSLKPTDISP